MDTHATARISSVTLMLSDDDFNPDVITNGSREDEGSFFVDFGSGRVQFWGTPKQLNRLGWAMVAGAGNMADQLAANEQERGEAEKARAEGEAAAEAEDAFFV